MIGGLKKYRKKELIRAFEFKRGMEDGFVTRFYDPNAVREDGSFSTWSIPGRDEEAEMQVPFVLDNNGHKVLAGDGYVIMTWLDGRMGSMHRDEFDKEYEAAGQ